MTTWYYKVHLSSLRASHSKVLSTQKLFQYSVSTIKRHVTISKPSFVVVVLRSSVQLISKLSRTLLFPPLSVSEGVRLSFCFKEPSIPIQCSCFMRTCTQSSLESFLKRLCMTSLFLSPSIPVGVYLTCCISRLMFFPSHWRYNSHQRGA